MDNIQIDQKIVFRLILSYAYLQVYEPFKNSFYYQETDLGICARNKIKIHPD